MEERARHVSALAGPVGAVLCGVLLFLCSERHTKTAKGVARTDAGDVYTLEAVDFISCQRYAATLKMQNKCEVHSKSETLQILVLMSTGLFYNHV